MKIKCRFVFWSNSMSETQEKIIPQEKLSCEVCELSCVMISGKILVCLVFEGIYIYFFWWGGGLIYKPQAKCHLVPLYLKECRHLCSSQLLFPQLKPKQSTWINTTTGNMENVYFWFEDLGRGSFSAALYLYMDYSAGIIDACCLKCINFSFFRSCAHEKHTFVFLLSCCEETLPPFFAGEPPRFVWHWHLFNESTSTETATSSQQENWRPIAPPIIQILSMQVRCTPDTGRSSESHICNCRIAVAENVSSIGRLAGNNASYERQTARLNGETVRQAQIKSNPAPIIWLHASRSALANLIPGLSHKKPSATQKKWQWESGWEVDVESVGARIIMNQGA